MKKTFKHRVAASNQLPVVLVVGGAGFIGSNLCRLLLSQNCYIICLDNLITGKKENIEAFLTNKNFHFIKHDLTQPLSKLNLPPLDYIFHLAGIESYLAKGTRYLKDLKTLLVNSLGTRNLLELAKKENCRFLLGSSPYVFEGLISTKELENYFGKKKDGQSLYSFAEAKRFSETLVFEYFKNYSLDCRIVRILDVYGPGMPLNTNNEIASLFNNLKRREMLQVPGEGTKIIYPTFIDDLVYGLLKAMFNQGSVGKIYTLADPREITLLNFAYTLKKISDFQVGIEFVAPMSQQTSVKKKELLKTKRELNWYPKIKLEEGLEKTLKWLKKTKLPKSALEEKKEGKKIGREVKKTEKKTKSAEPKRKLNKLLILLSALFLIIFSLPFLSFTLYLKKGINQMSQGQSSLALLSFQRSKRVLLEFNWLTSLPPLGKQKKEALSLLTLVNRVLEAENKKAKATDHFYNLIGIVIGGEIGDPEEEVKKIKIYLDQAWQDLSVVESELDKANLESNKFIILAGLKDKLKDFKKSTPDLRKRIADVREVLKILPEILAFKDKKTYLVLLQDNMELRPTGGFISSFAFLTFEKGKLLDFKVEDVYTADSQLKGRVEPPEPIKKYLGEANWYLRDSNWDPDFPTAAAQAEWFLEKELARNTDGTIGLTLNFIQEVLRNLGPIHLPEYDEIITADNLFERAVYYSEIDFSPGLGQKDFLNQLTSLLFKKIKQMEDEDWLKLGKAIEKGLVEKQLLISLNKGKSSWFFRDRGWDGTIRRQAITQEGVGLGDYLMLVEANLSVNKVNFFLKRKLKHETTILEEGELIESLTISYENTSASSGWPGGEYKNYLRLYLPPKSRLMSVKIGEDKNSFIQLSDSKIDRFEEHGKQIFGFLLTIPAKEKRLVKITYQPEDKIGFKNNLASYLLFWQKQPGVGADELKFLVNFPSSFKPIKIAPMAKLVGHQIIFSSDTAKDRAFLIEFKRQK